MVEEGLMKNRTRYIDQVIQSIDWRKIKSYYRKLGILWEYEVNQDVVKKIPTVADLKSDFRSLLLHMLDQEINYISYGSWIIFWEREDHSLGDIRVIFRLADFVFEEDKKSYNSLEEKLKSAIESEDYEYAAVIRDEIKNIRTL